MKAPTFLTLSCLAIAIPLLSQCSPYSGNGSGAGGQYLADYRSNSQTQVDSTPQGYWDGDRVTGAAKIRIVRAEQKAYFYRGGRLVGTTPISSGDTTHQTPAGRYKVTQKSKNHTSSLYGVIKNQATGETINKDADTRKHKAGPGEVFVHAPMPNFLRFNGAIGMHTGFLPGYPASHGCVRLPDFMAQKFFENASIGTPVIVE